MAYIGNVVQNMKEKILELLKQSEDYVSGQQICELLSVSRTAVWKHINSLKEEGYVIEAVPNKGYKLVMDTMQLSKAGIASDIKTDYIGRNLFVFDSIDSTNNEAKKMAEEGACDGTLVVADQQTAGKGRRGRSWESPKNSGIFMTIVLRPDIAPDKAPTLTLVAAMAVRDAIYKTTNIMTQIKWPNDLVYEGKKLCGILTEMSAEIDCIHYVVSGIGINVNIHEFPEEIKDKATSIALICGRDVKRNEIVAQFCNSFEGYYEKFLKTGDMKLLIEEYNNGLVNIGKEVRVLDPAGEYSGVSVGINDNGELIVKKEDNTLTEVMSGEVSVRGVYGYV